MITRRTTDFTALDAQTPLPPGELPRQWVLSRDRADMPEAWATRELHGWYLASHPDARVSQLSGSDGATMGWVIEALAYLEGSDGRVPADDLRLPIASTATAGEVERALYGRDDAGHSSGEGIQGMWVAIVFAGTAERPIRRVYLGAIHSVIYDPAHQVVATTHNLVSEVRRDLVLSRAFDALATNSFFTFGLTPFKGIHRLLPNHFLDLDTFDNVRHWPNHPLPALSSGEEGVVAIVENSRRLIAALGSQRFKVFLSAGRDSRAVLGMVRPFVDEGADVLLSTSVGKDLGSRIDLQAARELARITGLTHEVTHRGRHKAGEISVMRAFTRIGEAKGGPILSAGGVNDWQLRNSDGRFVLAGMGGETARRFYWPRRIPSEHETSPEALALRTKSPLIDPVLQAAATWRDGVPSWLGPANLLDLMYVEQRLGCWESSTRYLFPGRPLTTSPMTTTRNIELMLRLPEPYRASRLLQQDIVAHTWPDLLVLPFNEPRGLLRVQRRAKRAVASVRWRLPRHLRVRS